jgi:hypothetical protein
VSTPNFQPGTVAWEAMKVLQAPMTIGERRAALQKMREMFPAEAAVIDGFLESLKTEEEWTRARNPNMGPD